MNTLDLEELWQAVNVERKRQQNGAKWELAQAVYHLTRAVFLYILLK